MNHNDLKTANILVALTAKNLRLRNIIMHSSSKRLVDGFSVDYLRNIVVQLDHLALFTSVAAPPKIDTELLDAIDDLSKRIDDINIKKRCDTLDQLASKLVVNYQEFRLKTAQVLGLRSGNTCLMPEIFHEKLNFQPPYILRRFEKKHGNIEVRKEDRVISEKIELILGQVNKSFKEMKMGNGFPIAIVRNLI
jgi:hypothetical protein